MRRVVVTGLGMVAPTGVTVGEAWNTALAGKSAVGPITHFDATDAPVRIAAEVKGFDPEIVMNAKVARQSCRFVQFAAAATQEALQDANITDGSDRYGAVIGVGIGGFGVIEEQSLVCDRKGPRRVSPVFLPHCIPNMAPGFTSILKNLRGPNFCTASACASGTHAIGEAMMHIRFGTADVMVAGGTESTISPLCVASFARMKALSFNNDDPTHASRPFDLERDGFVMGEGGAVLVLEEFEHAKARGAKIYAEFVGYGLSADAYHITSPEPSGDGVVRCLRNTLSSGEINIDEVDYINAHGTSTKANDASESAAIRDVFGQHADKISISSTKGVTGHCLGAAGALEAVYTVLAMHHSLVPPTANYETPDPDCTLDYTPNQAVERPIRYAVSNSFGFGGQNACIAFRNLKAA